MKLGPLMRIICKADSRFSLAIRDGSVVMAWDNVHKDKFQQWRQDNTFSSVKDEANRPAFALVNEGSKQALKHGHGETHPVLLTQYDSTVFDESILWTNSGDISDGYATIRLANNILLNLDAFRGDKKSGGISDGNPIVLWSWKKGDNQLWKMTEF